MTEPRTTPPRTILLATDLSARCDRALDRAVQLASQWRAQLIALTVIESPRANDAFAAMLPSWRQGIDPMRLARRRLLADLSAAPDNVTPMVEEGNPAEVIARVAGERRCDLIITGLARDETLGRFSLGTTVDRLIRGAAAPVLIVKNRASRDYRTVVAASDFSPASRRALETAADWFPGVNMALFHAYDVPFSGMASDSATYRRDHRNVALAHGVEFLAGAAIAPETREAVKMVIEYGSPEELVQQYVQEFDVDLVVLGSRGRSAAIDLLIGNTATQILGRLECDALVVRG